MIGKIISQLLGGDDECEDGGDQLLEFEDGGWVIVSLPEVGPLLSPEESEPSVSVYQMRCGTSAADHRLQDHNEEDEGSDEENVSCRPVVSSLSFRRGHEWSRLAAWGIPRPVDLPDAGGGRPERKKLSRGALLRQNLTTVKTCERRRVFAHVKQPAPHNC
ncbi:si:ch211-260e23.9 [Syngnathus acus]|uniref:si:ch211-260e23.9 n=1 Tax=Syngnathus acus TaxID=161584 RepID=UPI0018862BF4|nr:si:ch211-260e23.9 [Syngnathus acus]